VEIQVDAAFRNLRTARSIAEAYERSLVPRAEGMVRILQESYEQGGTTLFEIIEAQHMLTSVRLEHLKAAAAYFRSVADLVRAAGGDGFMRDSSPGTQSGGERKP
jgi:outer membrane protein TolC